MSAFSPADRATFNAKLLRNYDEVTVRHSERSGWTCRIKHTVEARYCSDIDWQGNGLAECGGVLTPAVIERSSRCINLAVARAIDDALHNRWKKRRSVKEWKTRGAM